MTTDVESEPRATARSWLGLAVLVLPALLVSMDMSVLFMASPALTADLAPSAGQHLWIMDIYGFIVAGLLVTMGSLGDRIGRRKLLLIGAVAFGVASLVAALSTTAEMLLVARALLGVGGATLAPSTLSLIRGMFQDEDQRRTAVGIWTAAFTGGVAIGPIIAGFLLEYFAWGSVFLINVPVMMLLLIVAPFIIDESRAPASGGFDLLGAALSLATILPVVLGIKELAADGFIWFGAGAIVVGLVSGLLFVGHLRRHPDPMIDASLFTRPAFTASIATNLVLVFAVAGMGMLAVTHLQTVLGLTPLMAAVWTLPTMVGTVIGVTAASILARTVRPGILVTVALVIVAGGFGIVSTLTVDSGPPRLIAGYSLLAVGIGLASTVVTSLVLTTAPPEKAGAASAVSETSNELGGALGIAILGTLSASIYQGAMSTVSLPGLPPEAGQAATETIGGAMAVVEQLPPETADQLLQQAFAASTDGLTTSAMVGSVLLAVAAVVVGLGLRKVPS